MVLGTCTSYYSKLHKFELPEILDFRRWVLGHTLVRVDGVTTSSGISC